MAAANKKSSPSPSLYPNASVYSPTPMPGVGEPSLSYEPSAPPMSPSTSIELPSHDLLLELPAKIKQPRMSGTLRVLQFSENGSYHAFISLDNLNIPLHPACPVYKKKPSPATYELHIPDKVFTVIVDNAEEELIDSLERILKWFCKWEDDNAAGITDAPTATSDVDKYVRIGDKGVQLVESLGQRINAGIQRRMSRNIDAARQEPQRDVKMGGGATNAVLSGARSVVGVGASLASKVTEKVSDAVGKGLAKNAVTKNLAKAPEGSVKRRFHDNLMGGLLAFGKVYVAADRQGKIIIQTAGESSAELAGLKYGKEAENSARLLGGIALDGYRIARFPEKMGATALLKGALKSNVQKGDATGDWNTAAQSSSTQTPMGQTSQNDQQETYRETLI